MKHSPLSTAIGLLEREKSPEATEMTGGQAISTRIEKQREKLHLFLSEHAEQIQMMKTKSDQKEAYGSLEKWDRDFMVLSEIQVLPGIKSEGKKLQNEIFQKLGNNLFTRAQRAWSKPEDYVVPRVIVVNGEITFDPSVDISTVKGCIFDPEEISATLLWHFRRISTKKAGKSMEANILLLEEIYRQIPFLKKMSESLRSFEEGNLRLLVTDKSTPEVEARYHGVPDLDADLYGSILYMHTDGENEQETAKDGRPPSKLLVDFHPSIYGVQRMTNYQDRQYSIDEMLPLITLQNKAKLMVERLDQWTKETSDEVKNELKTEAMEFAGEVSAYLKEARNPFKKRAFQLIENLESYLQKHNVSAAMTKIVGSANAFENRFQDMARKARYNTMNGKAVAKHVKTAEDALKMNRSSVIGGARYLEQRDINNIDVPQYMGKVRMPRFMAQQLQVRPFSTYVSLHQETEKEVEDALRNKDEAAVRDGTLLLHLNGKMQAGNTCVEHLIAEISNLDTVSISRVKNFTQLINNVYEAREISPDYQPMHLADIFEPVTQQLKEMNALVSDVDSSIELDIQELKKFCDHLREVLDGFNFEQVARNLREKAKE